MRAAGLEISAREVKTVVLDANGSEVEVVETGVNRIRLLDHKKKSEIEDFCRRVETFFQDFAPDVCVVSQRLSKGNKAADGLSFKLEGLVQTQFKKDIHFVMPATIAKWEKQNSNIELPSNLFSYQEKAYRSVYYWIKKNGN